MKTIKYEILFFCLIMLAFAFISCSNFDVVGKDSVRAFAEVINTITPNDNGNEWRITAPDGTAQFIWNGERAAIIFDAAPFIAAGADLSAFTNISNGQILIGIDFQSSGKGKTRALDDYGRIVSVGRKQIGYHGALDHYGINLGDGNMFEWAKDMSTNDKDIVFVLNPAPFLAAGIDPNKIDGWAFAKVTVDDENGKPIVVDKILKPFNL